MSGELIDLAQRRSIPALERLEQLLEQVAETAPELGIAPFLAASCAGPRSPAARAADGGGGGPRELWPAVVDRTRDSAVEWLAVSEAPMSEPEQPQPGQGAALPSVPDVLLSTVQLLVTLAAEAIARREKLEEAAACDRHARRADAGGAAAGAGRGAAASSARCWPSCSWPTPTRWRRAAQAPQEQDEPSEPVVETPPRPKIWTPEGEV